MDTSSSQEWLLYKMIVVKPGLTVCLLYPTDSCNELPGQRSSITGHDFKTCLRAPFSCHGYETLTTPLLGAVWCVWMLEGGSVEPLCQDHPNSHRKVVLPREVILGQRFIYTDVWKERHGKGGQSQNTERAQSMGCKGPHKIQWQCPEGWVGGGG